MFVIRQGSEFITLSKFAWQDSVPIVHLKKISTVEKAGDTVYGLILWGGFNFDHFPSH